jgi:hypothetical protein
MEPTEPQDALQVREPHFDTLAIVPRLLVNPAHPSGDYRG